MSKDGRPRESSACFKKVTANKGGVMLLGKKSGGK